MKTVLFFFFFYLNSLGIVLVQTQTLQAYVGYSPTDCKLTKAGHEYAGPLSVTQSGRTCQRWDSDKLHDHRFKNGILFPEGSAEAAGNRCRNPNSLRDDGVWCYTTENATQWDYCKVDFCDCKLSSTGEEYAGPRSVTRSGLTCQRWNSNQPHINRSISKSNLFPEGSVSAAGNKCRNPSRDKGGVWCYTTDINKEWEHCDVNLCKLDATSSPGWQAILLVVFAALLIFTGGIALYLYRERGNAAIRKIPDIKNTVIRQPYSIEDEGRTTGAPADGVREDSTYECIIFDSTDLILEEARIPEQRNQPTERPKATNSYMTLSPSTRRRLE